MDVFGKRFLNQPEHNKKIQARAACPATLKITPVARAEFSAKMNGGAAA